MTSPARHVYGTIIGTHRAFLALKKSKRAHFLVHMTSGYPVGWLATSASWVLLHELTDAAKSTMERVEIKATIFYAGVVPPGYCYVKWLFCICISRILVRADFVLRLQNTVRDIKRRLMESPPRLPDWLHVYSSSIPSILDPLDH